MEWKDGIKNDLEGLKKGTDWRARITDRDRWKAGCMMANGIVV